jgi:hypothetical protein
LIKGPPGCGKTNWIRETLLNHSGTCAYLRLDGSTQEGLELGRNAGIDHSWLIDQIPQLQQLSDPDPSSKLASDDRLVLIEAQQFSTPSAEGLGLQITQQLERLHLTPDRTLHFGLDPELPKQDTLEFSKLEAWYLDLQGCVWDPNSLSSFWFELVNGAYGDVYRAKALMNMPDGRSFFCNWMVSQSGSQFLPLQSVAPPTGRPNRPSHLVIQGKGLIPASIQSTINDCLLSDEVLELQQAPLREQQPNLQPTLPTPA